MKYVVQYSKQKPEFVVGRTRTVGIRLVNVMKKYRKLTVKDFDSVTAYWSHSVPIESEMRYRGGDVFLLVGANDKIFGWVSQGTEVRYATMTKGFVPKTTPNSLETNQGAGGLWFVSRKHPHAGIIARNFESQIHDKYAEGWRVEVRNAVLQGIRAFVERGRR